jgi:hypothetical protein
MIWSTLWAMYLQRSRLCCLSNVPAQGFYYRGCKQQCFVYQVSKNAGRGTPLLITGSAPVCDCNWPSLCRWLIGPERTNRRVRIRKIYADPLASAMRTRTAIDLNLQFHLFSWLIIFRGLVNRARVPYAPFPYCQERFRKLRLSTEGCREFRPLPDDLPAIRVTSPGSSDPTSSPATLEALDDNRLTPVPPMSKPSPNQRRTFISPSVPLPIINHAFPHYNLSHSNSSLT